MENASKHELIVTTWRRLAAERIGRKELRAIQKVLAKQFGENAVQSPASIARLLADEGADLKHPEIIEFDAQWREAQLETEKSQFKIINEIISEPSLSIEKGAALINELERLRRQCEQDGDREALRFLKNLAIEARQSAQARSKVRSTDEVNRREQKEIAEWLSIWLQTPELFEQWLELRKRSPEFKQTFAR